MLHSYMLLKMGKKGTENGRCRKLSHQELTNSSAVGVYRQTGRQTRRKTEAAISTTIMKMESGHMIAVLAGFLSN